MTDHSDWEFFQDEGYFGMWCVREKGVRRFGEGFHTVSKEEAEALASALSSQSLSLSEAREEIERLKGLVAGIREFPQEPGSVEFVKPGAKKAGDRISLPGGWYYERANDDGVIFVPRRPDGRGFGLEGNGKGLAVTIVQDFAKAMWQANKRGGEA